MGRSRKASFLQDDDPNSRAKRRKTSSGAETPSTGMSEEKAGLYHCNYCNKDISGRIRLKCAVCPDYDLCVECFSVGAQLTPHYSNHPYRVMDNLSFPLICPDWNADEEMVLLEGIGMYGFGNWNEVADYVGTKSKRQCIDHYNVVYMNSPFSPLPDMSRVMGKSREELLAMAEEPGEIKKESPVLGELAPKDEPTAARPKCEESRKEDSAHQSSSSLTSELSPVLGSNVGSTYSGAVKKSSSKPQIKKDDVKLEESQSDRSIGEKKLRILGDEQPSMTEFGYNAKRREFDIEYDNEAEQLLADMEFKDSDSDADYEMKLQVLRIYSKRLDERKRRKEFIVERNILYSDQFEKSLSPEEREIYKRYKVFMRYHSKEEHEQLLKSIIEEHHIMKRIQDLQEARAAGCRTASEANRFLEKKRKEAQEIASRLKESSQAGPTGKLLQKPNHLKGEEDDSSREPGSQLPGPEPGPGPAPQAYGKDTSSVMQAISSSIDNWDITGFVGAELLSESEKKLCNELRILPSHYLNMLRTISEEISKGSVTKRSDAHSLFKVEPSKVDRVYDMLVEKGVAQAQA